MISRIQHMENPNPRNLAMFLRHQRRAGKYRLVPAVIGPGEPKFLYNLAILKRRFVIRPAWEIGENDPDSIALHEDDRPIVPVGLTNPPVVAALARRARMVAGRQ